MNFRSQDLRIAAVRWAAAPMAIALVLASPAAAQQADALEESVERRPRLDFESYGLSLDRGRAGSTVTGAAPAYLFTRLEVETGYDDNVQRTSSNALASSYGIARPGVALRLDGETSTISVTAQADLGRVARSDEDNFDDLELAGFARFEIDDDIAVTVFGDVGTRHLDRSSDTDLGPGFELTTFRTYAAGVRLVSDAFEDHRIDTQLSTRVQRFDETSGVDRGDLDRRYVNGRLRVGLAQIGEVRYFAQPGILRVDYLRSDSANESSTRLDLAVGATYDASSVSYLSGYVGGSYKQFDSDDLDSEVSGLLSLDAVWNFTPVMSLTGGASIANEDTELLAANSVLTSTFRIGLGYEPLDNLILGATYELTDNDYDETVADERITEIGLTARYLLNEYLYVAAGLRQENKASDDSTDEYDALVGSLRIGAKLCCLRDVDIETRAGREVRQGVVYGVFR